MAFCNSCGASLNPGAQFCAKCGGKVAGSATPNAAPAGGSNSVKIVLIVVAVIVVLGLCGLAAVGFIGYHMARNSHVTKDGDNVRVETPFGTVENSKDPDMAAKNLGIDIYPGSQVQKDGASSATFGGIHSVAASFESSDSADQVCNFYRARFPSSMVTTSDKNRCTIVSNDKQNMITINVEASGDGSRFQITNVSKNAK